MLKGSAMTAKTRKQQIEEMLADMPQDPELHYMLAMEHASAGNDAEAVRVFQDLMERFPNYTPGFHQGARALVRLNRVDEARVCHDEGRRAVGWTGWWVAGGCSEARVCRRVPWATRNSADIIGALRRRDGVTTGR